MWRLFVSRKKEGKSAGLSERSSSTPLGIMATKVISRKLLSLGYRVFQEKGVGKGFVRAESHGHSGPQKEEASHTRG